MSEADLVCRDGRSAAVLDIIDAPATGRCNDSVQPENVFLDRNRQIEIRGRMRLEEVLKLHPLEKKRMILGNEYGYITETKIHTVGYSLVVIEVSDLCLIHEENIEGKNKMKARFVYQEKEYENMSVTDPNFYCIQGEKKFKRAILVVSIGTPYNGR